MKTYLESKGIDINKAFRCLSPEHEDKHPSMHYDPQRNRIKCFSCHVDYDLFGLIKAEYNIEENKNVYAKMEELGLRENNYFNQRGLSNETINKYKLTVQDDFAVIPTSDSSYVSRNVDPKCTKGNRYRKSSGEAHLLTSQELVPSEPIFITEGEFDALSVIEMGKQAIALGGVANKGKLYSLLGELQPQKSLILALDNDEAGKQATQELETELNAKGYKTLKFELQGKYKDLNEFLADDKFQFAQALNMAVKTALVDYTQNSAAAHLAAFLGDIEQSVNTPAIPTQFDKLDKVLDGGFYEGLYILGALSSLGKTTFMLQIADQMAQYGNDILFLSLEMARSELMAKSISRLTYQFCAGDVNLAKTARGIMNGKRYFADEHGKGGYSDEQKTHITDSISEYAKYAENLYFIESSNDIKLAEAIELHRKERGKTPIVMIDYLQLLAPLDVRLSDKQAIDQNVMMLKQISRQYKTPVLAISSLNRSSYSKPITMESFKESGGIEYSSDVLFGLQPAGIGEEDFRIDEYKKSFDREVELVILKNRNGRTGDKLTFEYIPAYNHFDEV